MVKVATVIQALALAAASSHIDAIGLLHRHGARTTLRDFGAPEDDYKWQEDYGELTPAGYSQALLAGFRWYLSYKHLFEGERFLHSDRLKVISSDIERSWETGVGVMTGWNRQIELPEKVYTRGDEHFGDGAFADRADKNSEMWRSIVDRADILKTITTSRHRRLVAQAHSTAFVRDFVKNNRAIANKLFDSADFAHSAVCQRHRSVESCREKLTLEDLGQLVGNHIPQDFHSARTKYYTNHRQQPKDVREFEQTVIAAYLAKSYLGRYSDLIFSDLIHELFMTASHRKTADPVLELMMSHDSTMVAFMLGLGLSLDELPHVFFADAIAMELSLGHRDGEASCARFLYNGMQPLITERFRACPRSLPGQGWVNADDLLEFAEEVRGATQQEDDAAQRELLEPYGGMVVPLVGTEGMDAEAEEEETTNTRSLRF